MPAPVSMTGMRAFSRTKRISPAPPRGDDYVDIAHGAKQRPHGFVPRGEQREGVFVDAFGAERFVRSAAIASLEWRRRCPLSGRGVARLDARAKMSAVTLGRASQTMPTTPNGTRRLTMVMPLGRVQRASSSP